MLIFTDYLYVVIVPILAVIGAVVASRRGREHLNTVLVLVTVLSACAAVFLLTGQPTPGARKDALTELLGTSDFVEPETPLDAWEFDGEKHSCGGYVPPIDSAIEAAYDHFGVFVTRSEVRDFMAAWTVEGSTGLTCAPLAD